MRILVCHKPGGAFGYITDAWINAFRHSGFTAERWDNQRASWDHFKPDLYLGCSGHRQKIPSPKARGRCKVAIHVNPQGKPSIKNIDESNEAINWTMERKPDAVFGYGFEKDRHFWEKWDQSGTQWVPMACAGDATRFSPDKSKHRNNDIIYLGGYWGYKSKRIDKFLLPAIRSIKYRCAVHGWGQWPNDMMCRGAVEERHVPSLLASGIVGPCVSEPHTGTHGIDIPERVFKISLSGTIAVHDKIPGLQHVLPNVETSGDLCSVMDKILGMSDKERDGLARAQYADVIYNHTYHHRLSLLLQKLGFQEESGQMMVAVEDLVCPL